MSAATTTLEADLAVLDEADRLFVARRLGSLRRFAEEDPSSAPAALRGGLGCKRWARLTDAERLEIIRAAVVAESAERRRAILAREERRGPRTRVPRVKEAPRVEEAPLVEAAPAPPAPSRAREAEARQARMIAGLVGTVPCSSCGEGEFLARAGRAVVRFCDPCRGAREGARRHAERVRRSDRLAREGAARAAVRQG